MLGSLSQLERDSILNLYLSETTIENSNENQYDYLTIWIQLLNYILHKITTKLNRFILMKEFSTQSNFYKLTIALHIQNYQWN